MRSLLPGIVYRFSTYKPTYLHSSGIVCRIVYKLANLDVLSTIL